MNRDLKGFTILRLAGEMAPVGGLEVRTSVSVYQELECIPSSRGGGMLMRVLNPSRYYHD